MCILGKIIECAMQTYEIYKPCAGVFHHIIANVSYISCIIYLIFTNSNTPFDRNVEIYNIVTAWLFFEIMIFFYWIISSIVFLIYAFCFNTKSKWKKYEETLGILDQWDNKASTDFLHYHQFEVDNFSLICAPLFLSIHATIYDTSKEHEEYYVNYSIVGVRLMVLV